MQFVGHGPDIPDALLQAHEEGRVVFFCGAGISRLAGLPDFGGLVQQLFQRVGEPSDKTEGDLIAHGEYDRAIGHYERRIQGGRTTTRRGLPPMLTADLTKRRALTTHLALLTLGRSRDGGLKLVTTNFDTLFEDAVNHYRLSSPNFYHDPPTRLRWDGVVHLHGRMPAKPSIDDLDQLVLSDGDFGQAYLTQGWAARFVAGLFRDYTLCFVGYSIDDPVLRYMTAANALDGAQKIFAFASYETGKAEIALQAWKDKHVTPILYDDAESHRGLHRTLHIWASLYRDGIRGKERLVALYAHRLPKESTPQNDFVGRMLWALSDKSGLPAKRFTNCNPAPSLDWLLDGFSDERYRNTDLERFGIPAKKKTDGNLRFSLIRRPAPYDHVPPMRLVSGGDSESKWDDVMFHLARWLVRHLDDPRLVIWIAERGGQLHDRLLWLIEHELDRFASLECEGKTSELNEIRLHAPKAIPGPLMRTLWRLLVSSRVKSPWHDPDLYRWKSRLKREGLTATLRLELRELLAPKVVLKKPFRWGEDDSSSADEPIRIKQLVDWELALAADHVHSTLRDLANEPWKFSLPHLLEDFQQLLRDALDLLRELGEADDRSDRSHWDLPSITSHGQNRGVRDWVSLIELLRDAWLAVRANDSARATRIAQNWFELPYPTFKRLALFAASQDDCISPKRWVNWLLADDALWLWSTDTGREVFRLLVLQGRHLAGAEQQRLETAILAGPPREMYRDDLEEYRWQDLVARSVWLHLAKLNTSGVALGASAAARLAEISSTYPQWQLVTNERDEFSHWMSGTGDPDYEDSRDVDIAPRKRQELVQWLTKPMPERRAFYEDTWRDVCKTRFFHSIFALGDLAQDGVWPAERWREALQTWAEEGMVLRSWRYAASLVQSMPDAVLQEIAHSVTRWMEAASKSINSHDGILFDLCHRILALPLETGSGSRIIRNGVETYDPVGSAINHPIGHTTQALINLWFKQNPNDNDLLPADLKPIFTALCDVQVDRFRHGRVLLGSRLIAFFRVDRPWTEQHLLPLFGWSSPVEAKAVWEGFLWSPRLYQPLLTAFKSQFLDSANHYLDLGEHRQQFAALLTYAALGPTEGYTADDFRSALSKLPLDGLAESAQSFYQAIASSGDQRESYWRHRAQPFWIKIWPKSRERATPKISEFLTLTAIAARDEFPAALTEIKDWVKPIDHPHTIIHSLQKSGLCAKFSDAALSLLDLVIADQQWGARDVDDCLDQIVQAKPSLAQDSRCLRLREYVRRRGAI